MTGGYGGAGLLRGGLPERKLRGTKGPTLGGALWAEGGAKKAMRWGSRASLEAMGSYEYWLVWNNPVPAFSPRNEAACKADQSTCIVAVCREA